jgi:hypothetical protein
MNLFQGRCGGPVHLMGYPHSLTFFSKFIIDNICLAMAKGVHYSTIFHLVLVRLCQIADFTSISSQKVTKGEVTNYGKWLDVTKEPPIESDLNGFIAWRIDLYEGSQYRDYELWEAYVEDFEGFTETLFQVKKKRSVAFWWTWRHRGCDSHQMV